MAESSMPMKSKPATSLAELAQKIGAIERRHSGSAAVSVNMGLSTPLDRLDCGVLHEWFSPCQNHGRAWVAPTLLLTHFAKRRICDPESNDGSVIVWIGRPPRIWPQPQTLLVGSSNHNRFMLDRSLFVDPPTDADRLWAIDLCLRSAAVAVVIADGSAINLSHSRRLQLAAEAGSALALLARPSHELTVPSSAGTRWRIEPVVSPTARPRWRVELVRCKGVQRGSGMEANATLVLEHDRAKSSLCVVADVADRSISTTVVALRRSA